MKTTIVVEDGGVVASQPASVEAGAAPSEGVGQPATGAQDGGMPPSWLVESIAQAGGVTVPEDGDLTGLDGGAAPA
jgi:hypothetical protein